MNNLWQRVVLGLAILGLTGCATRVAEKPDLVDVWPNVVRGVFRLDTETPYLILLVPEEGRTAGSDFPALIVPAGPAGFDRFTPLAFLPEDEPPPQPPAPPNPGGEGADEDSPDEEAVEPEEGDDDTGSPFEDWPSVNTLEWPPGGPEWPPVHPWPPVVTPPWPVDPSSLTDEDIDEMLDDALRRAYEDEEPPEEEPEEGDDDEDEEHPLEDRLWTPSIPPGLPSWWDPLDVPDLSPEPDEEPDLDLRLPRWKDLDPDMLPPPGWPPGVPWPPDDDYRLPERWRPDDGGFRLGGWRIYLVPLRDDGH